jgi:CDP-glycerol glycerophosphotransferase
MPPTPRFSVVLAPGPTHAHPATDHGPGDPAVEVVLPGEPARGDYLVFLGPGEEVVAGAFGALEARVRAAGEPELVCFGRRAEAWEGPGEGPAAELALAGAGTFRVAERPELLGLAGPGAGHAVRRGSAGAAAYATAGDGPYGRSLAAHQALLAAEQVAVLDRVLVTARPPAPRGAARAHFAVFEQYTRLLALLAGREHPAALRPALFARAVRHIAACLADPDRVPPRLRRDFRRAAAHWYAREVPPGFTPPPEAAAACAALARGGPGRGLWAGAAYGGRWARRLRRTLARAAVRAAVRAARAWGTCRPLDPCLALYAAAPAHDAVGGGAAAVWATAARLAPGVRGVWITDANDNNGNDTGNNGNAHGTDATTAALRVPPGAERVRAGTPRHALLAARAKYLVVEADATWETPPRRPGAVRVRLAPRTPLAAEGAERAHRTGAPARPALVDGARWDLHVVAGPYAAAALDRAHPGARCLAVGAPRADALARAGAAESGAARAALGVPPGRRTLLYLPGVRLPGERRPFPLDLERVCRGLGAEYTVLARCPSHPGAPAADPARAACPACAELRHLHRAGLLLDVTAETSLAGPLLAADLLVTDHAAAVCDWVVLDRPVIVHAAAPWEVRRVLAAAETDLATGAPGPVVADADALLAAVRAPGTGAPRTAFRERFAPYGDGRAAERVVRRVFLGEPAPRLPEPPVRAPAPRGNASNPAITPPRAAPAHEQTGAAPSPR